MMSFQIYTDSTLAVMVADLTTRIISCAMTTADHGDETIDFAARITPSETWRFYDNALFYWIVISDNAGPVWQGRMESPNISYGVVAGRAFGGWSALSDAPYTAFWSDNRYGKWFVPSDDDISVRTPEKYRTDTNNRLYATCVAGETYSNNADATGFIYRVPHRNRNDILHIAFDYEIDLPTNWRLQTVVWDDALSSFNVEDTVTSAGTPASGSKSLSLTSGYEAVEIIVYNSTGGNSTPTGDNGTNYIKITNVRVKGTTSTNVYADEIADDIATFINSVNSTQLSSSTARIESPTTDLPEAIFEDESPADILTDLANLGDNSTPPLRYETGVEDGIYLYFRPRGTRGLTWYTNDIFAEINRDGESLVNSAYGVYRDERGFTRRTAVSDDTDSQDIYGITKRTAVSVKTSSDTFAQTVRDTTIEDAKTIRPQAELSLQHVQAESGGHIPPWWVRAGDEIVLRSLPPDAGQEADRIRQFRIIRTGFDLMTRAMTVSPENELPTLSVQLAQAQGYGRGRL